MDRQLALAEGRHMSWEAGSSDSAEGLKFLGSEKENKFVFFLKFWRVFFHITKYSQK